MPVKKSTKKRTRVAKRKSPANPVKRVKKSAKTAVAKAGTSLKKPAGAVAKSAKKLASNPRRTVKKAADNVHVTASRARDLGDSVVTAGQLMRETADFVDSLAQRAKSRVAAKKTTKRR